MSRFPLDPLCKVRALRLQNALRAVRECRAALDAAEAVRDEAAQRLHAAIQHHDEYRDQWLREMSRGTHGAAWIKRHERHLILLETDIEQLRQRLAEAEDDVQRARAALDEALAAYRRMQAKADALQSYRQTWSAQQHQEQERRDERAVEDLRLPRGATAR